MHPEGFGNLSSAKVRSSVRAMVTLLYRNIPLPENPLSDIPPVKLDRNRELYERYKAGERVADLAREYGISVRRTNRLIKRFATKGY